MPLAVVHRVHLYYETRGRGPSVLFILELVRRHLELVAGEVLRPLLRQITSATVAQLEGHTW